MTTSRRLLKPVAFLAAVGLATIALALPQPETSTKQPSAAGAPLVMMPAPTSFDRFDFTFKGGTLSEFAAALRAASAPQPCNIFISGQGEEPRLPAFEFRGVKIATAATAAERAERTITLSAVQEDDGAPVYVFSYGSKQRGSATTEVLSIRGLLDAEPKDPEGVAVTLTAETVLSAVEGAVSMAEAESVPLATIKFHKESGLLFIRGTERQIGAVRSSINLLQSDVQRRRVVFDDSSARRMEADIAKNQIEIDYLQERAKMMETDVARAKQMVEQGVASDTELKEPRERLADIRRRLDQALIDQNQMQAELRIVRGRANPKPASTKPSPQPAPGGVK